MDRQKTHLPVDELASADRYKLITGLVTPRPIGWIGTRSLRGVTNLAPYSFFNGVAADPPTIYFSAGLVNGHRKDSLRNAEDTGEFTVSIVSGDNAAAMNESSATLGPDQSEFAATGLTELPSITIGAPGVAEAKAILECRVVGTHTFGDPQTIAYVMVLGEVQRFVVDDGVLDGTRINADVLDSVGRLAGNGYATTRDRFTLARPA